MWRPDAEKTLKALQRARCKKIFTNRRTEGTTKHPTLTRCLKTLKDGDTLAVWKLDHLAHSLRDLTAMLEAFHKRGIHFRSLTEEINTATPGGRLIFHIFGALAKFERGLIIERTHEGMKAAIAHGIKSGPLPKLTRQQINHARQLIEEEGKRREEGADLFKVSRSTLYRALAASA